MKKLLTVHFMIAAVPLLHAQETSFQQMQDAYKQHFGIKVGTNWSYVNGSTQGFKPDNKTGFMVSAFYAPTSRTGRGFRSEVVFSRQGYSFDNGGKNTEVLNDYIYLPQMATFGIGKFFQLQAGAQVGILLNSKLSNGTKDTTATSFMNRLDYGFAAGVELNPIKGFLIGGRYNLGLGKLYKQYEQSSTTPMPFPLPFNPDKTDMKNGVVQFFIGYRF